MIASRGSVTARNHPGSPITNQSFTIDQANRVTALGGTSSETYSYDGMGRRATIGSTASTYRVGQIYSQAGQMLGTGCIPPAKGGNCANTTIRAKTYIYLDRHLIAREDAQHLPSQPTVAYLHTDGLGSPIAETDDAGYVVSRTLHEPYGLVIGATAPQGPGFTGHVVDAATGLSYMQQRYYDPVAGRFLSVDTVAANAGSFNRYWYANNSPYRYVDPNGRYACTGSHIDCGGFEQGLSFARDQVAGSSLPGEEKNQVMRVIAFYGTEDDGNNVSVRFADDAIVGGSETMNGDKSVDISLRPDGNLNNLMKNAIHEGEHGVNDIDRGRSIANRGERYETEVKAYTVQGYYQKAIGYSTSSRDPWVFGKGISEANIGQKAQESVSKVCGTSTAGSCGE